MVGRTGDATGGRRLLFWRVGHTLDKGPSPQIPDGDAMAPCDKRDVRMLHWQKPSVGVFDGYVSDPWGAATAPLIAWPCDAGPTLTTARGIGDRDRWPERAGCCGSVVRHVVALWQTGTRHSEPKGSPVVWEAAVLAVLSVSTSGSSRVVSRGGSAGGAGRNLKGEHVGRFKSGRCLPVPPDHGRTGGRVLSVRRAAVFDGKLGNLARRLITGCDGYSRHLFVACCFCQMRDYARTP